MSTCRTWSMPAKFINGLCASEYKPEDGLNACVLCVKPVEDLGDPVLETSDASTCIVWEQSDALHFHGFCTNSFRLKTPGNHVRISRGCRMCSDPARLFGPECTGCSGLAPPAYVVNITIDGNGVSGGSPDYGCGIASYSGEFALYHGPSNCIWSSAEKELQTYSVNGSGTDPVTCDAISDSNARPRVQLRLSTVNVVGVLKTVYAVTVNWYGGESPYGTGLNLCSVTARGIASTLDCFEPVANCEYYSRVINIGLSTAWANPYVNGTGGGNQIEMTASVRPL